MFSVLVRISGFAPVYGEACMTLRSAAQKSAREQVVDGNTARAADEQHDEHGQIGELLQCDEVEHASDVVGARGDDRDDHADDEWNGRKACKQSEHERHTAEELGVADQHRVEGGPGDVQRSEELGHFIEVVDLAPAGTDEQQTDGQASDERPEPVDVVQLGEHAGA